MKKIIISSIAIFLLVVMSGCVSQESKDSVCGDGICSTLEDCNRCAKDCSCKNGEYCSDVGICLKETCGDEICSNSEKQASSCCEDCSCANEKICNKVTQKCIEKTALTDTEVRTIAEDYLKKNSISGKITNLIDTYYKEQAVKQVTIDCMQEGSEYPCQMILYIDNRGSIIEELRTS